MRADARFQWVISRRPEPVERFPWVFRRMHGAGELNPPFESRDDKQGVLKRYSRTMITESVPTANAEKPRRWFPRFGPREVEIHEHEHGHDDHEPGVEEWKTQLVASLICLGFAIAGYFVPTE